MFGRRRPYHRRPPAQTRVAQAARTPRWKSLAEGALQFGRRVHHERTVLRNRLAQRLPGHHEHLRRRRQTGRREEADAGGARLVAENGHALGIDASHGGGADIDAAPAET